ncbi:MAG: hypothetical protein JJ855_06580 [Rhodospirillales bacterium]|nr:hypothetical protein [Rhodospirillales bacterium]
MRILGLEDIQPLETLSQSLLDEMYEAGQSVLECERNLLEAGSNVVAELLEADRDFYQWDHYPDGDVYCPGSHAQYYYHSHPPDVRGNSWGEEHGHFHTFLRQMGFPAEVAEDASPDPDPASPDTEPPAHLVAISMGFDGKAARLFTTNRWVTGEAWCDAPIVTRLLRHFHIGHHDPSPIVNQWINGMLILFRPTVEALLHARDDVVAQHAPETSTHVLDDKNLEVTSISEIDVNEQMMRIIAARGRRSA